MEPEELDLYEKVGESIIKTEEASTQDLFDAKTQFQQQIDALDDQLTGITADINAKKTTYQNAIDKIDQLLT